MTSLFVTMSPEAIEAAKDTTFEYQKHLVALIAVIILEWQYFHSLGPAPSTAEAGQIWLAKLEEHLQNRRGIFEYQMWLKHFAEMPAVLKIIVASQAMAYVLEGGREMLNILGRPPYVANLLSHLARIDWSNYCISLATDGAGKHDSPKNPEKKPFATTEVLKSQATGPRSYILQIKLYNWDLSQWQWMKAYVQENPHIRSISEKETKLIAAAPTINLEAEASSGQLKLAINHRNRADLSKFALTAQFRGWLVPQCYLEYLSRATTGERE